MKTRTSDNPWRRWSPFGKVAHANGSAPALLEAGWLPRRQAAELMGMSLRVFDQLVEDGTIRRKKIGPRACLYEVTRDA